LTFKEVLIIDSTTIRLFSDILKGVGRNPKGDGKKKGGMKVHMLIDAVQSVGRFIKMTAAKVNDLKFLKSLDLISNSIIVFDKAYNYYHQFALWTQKEVYFVTRMKKNAVFTVIEVKRSHYRKKGQAKVLRDEIIELEYHPEKEDGKQDLKTKLKMRLRKVSYQDEQNRYFDFLTNNFDIEAEDVAFLYKKRWGIEILQENEAELPVTLLLWRERKCNLYSGLVHIDSPIAIDSYTEDRAGKESLLGRSLIGSDTFNKHAGCKGAASQYKKKVKDKSIPPGLQLSFNM